jgi:hypothetical protein
VVLARHHEHVTLEDRPDVEERHDVLGLEHEVGRLIVPRDGAEQAAHGAQPRHRRPG